MKRVNVLTEGAILLALFTVLTLMTLYLPLFGAFLMVFLPLPFILYTVRHGIKAAFTLMAASILITLIVGSLFALPLTLTYALSGIVMGYFYQKRQTAGALIGGTIAFLISFVVMYAASAAFFQIDPIEEATGSMNETIDMAKSMMAAIGQEANEAAINQLEEQMKYIGYLIPSLLVSVSFIFALLSHAVTVPVLKRLKIQLLPLKPFREWKLPSSIVWYYLIVSFLLFFNLDTGSFLYIAAVNLLFVLQVLLVVQGFSFIFFYSHVKKYSKAIPVTAVILSLILPILMYLVRILGIIDLAFNLRGRVKK
ncbi:YybS family protein [Metabacillus idriensis]|uniref:YybS family protein n=1 Tax=Metabacillus idriensis TaxID=324768 RepID=UPI002813A72F|nr:YybS family protein [Metabacillus idriensis]MDR0139116.1 YybS family protein [Metabacillus idriensis]